MPVLESSADTKYQHSLPTVSFRIITDEKSLPQPAGVHSEQSRSYGYNDFSDFERPEYYIRYIEPIESELKVQVEYDMDEQDQAWLDAINAERLKEQSGPISYEVFEILMDKLEKEWFELIKRIPQPASHLPVEDSKCAVCDDGEGENSNAIVFCDGCNLAVHQDCYGVPYIPEGQWLCRKCTVSPENPVSCLFCPNEGGAFKQTSTGRWCHLLCAIWIPELGVGNAIYMEPVEGVEAVPKNRWKLICSLCRERTGACIQCDNRNCFTAFHVTCARQMGLLQSMKSMGSDTTLRAFCEKHLPADARGTSQDDDEASDFSATPAVTRRKGSQVNKVVTTKSARAHAKSYRPGPPIVPQLIVQSLLDYVAKVSIRKRHPFVERLCRYWSLKREARRGAPLLKRLHLEPWTATSASKHQTDAEKATKLKFLTKLRNDLEKVRMLAELVRKREKEKLRQAQVVKDIVDSFLFPHYGKLRLTLEKISAMDRNDIFLHPVNRVEVPDYFDVIKEPMCWLYIDEKLEKNGYLDVDEFIRDIDLVLDNALLYNKADTPFNRIAKRIKTNAQPLLDELASISAQAAFTISNGEQNAPSGMSGDLEPSDLLLQMLTSTDTSNSARDFLASIFTFELEKPKEPTPPPPTPPPKKKSLTWAERQARRAEKDAKAREERLLSGRATRAAHAATQAFATEIGVLPSSENGPLTPAAESSKRRSGRTRQSSSEIHDLIVAEHPKRSNKQRGVVGVETIAVLSDKERRAQERALDIMAESLDPSDQFKRFNVGWVLPEGSKRRRSERPPEIPRATPVRKPKTEPALSFGPESAGPSRSTAQPSTGVPSASASPLSSLTPEVSPAKGKAGTSSKASAPTSSTVDSGKKRKPVEYARTTNKKRKIVHSPSDTEHTAQFAADEATPLPPTSDLTRTEEESEEEEEEVEMVEHRGEGGVADEDGDVEMDMDKDDSIQAQQAQEDVESEDAPGRHHERVNKVEMGDAESQVGEEEGEGGGDDDDRYPPGTLVWARLFTFPYFPAEVIDEKDPEGEEDIPDSVYKKRAQLEKENHADGARTWLVRFFDKQASYGWIPASRLSMLGDDNDIDAMYLAGKEKGKSKGFKTSSLRVACRKAYREAIQLMERESEREGEDAA